MLPTEEKAKKEGEEGNKCKFTNYQIIKID